MFDPKSRYAELPNASLLIRSADGMQQTLVYKVRRLLPIEPSTAAVEHKVDDGDRLDRVTATYLGDPTLYWKLCDRNGCLHPRELTAEPGRLLCVRGSDDR